MTSLESTTVLTASILPFEPTVGITVVASIALVLIVAFMTYLTFAPVDSPSVSEQVERSSVETTGDASGGD
ncbi:hypothetical protein OB905_00370 [Halobacteria archaeon AArc-dxtr1]|nr:hypothetical protein [Halobacteria archaeon AArc-dxtr1]